MVLARVKLVVVSLNKLESKQESATFKFKLPESLIVMSELAVMRLKWISAEPELIIDDNWPSNPAK